MSALVANARMYAVTPAAEEAWHALFDWLARESGVALEAIDHAFPAPLSDLWTRPDLGCGFVCGLPFLLHLNGYRHGPPEDMAPFASFTDFRDLPGLARKAAGAGDAAA